MGSLLVSEKGRFLEKSLLIMATLGIQTYLSMLGRLM